MLSSSRPDKMTHATTSRGTSKANENFKLWRDQLLSQNIAHSMAATGMLRYLDAKLLPQKDPFLRLDML
jgi:hypothetical protein